MNTRHKKAQNLRQVLLLMMAQALAIASMIWGGSFTVGVRETPVQVMQVDEDLQHLATASKNKPAGVRLFDFSIGKPWG